MYVRKNSITALVVHHEAMPVPDLTHKRPSVRPVDHHGSALVLVAVDCDILRDGERAVCPRKKGAFYASSPDNDKLQVRVCSHVRRWPADEVADGSCLLRDDETGAFINNWHSNIMDRSTRMYSDAKRTRQILHTLI